MHILSFFYIFLVDGCIIQMILCIIQVILYIIQVIVYGFCEFLSKKTKKLKIYVCVFYFYLSHPFTFGNYRKLYYKQTF